MPMAPAFTRYIGIDYSGAQTPQASLNGLRVYCADGAAAAQEVLPQPSPRKYWTRRGIAEWLADRLAEDIPTIVGIDRGFPRGRLPSSRSIRHFGSTHSRPMIVRPTKMMPLPWRRGSVKPIGPASLSGFCNRP